MNIDLERRAAAVFESVVEWPAPERDARVADLCGDDTALLRRVRELLVAASQDDHPLDGELAGIGQESFNESDEQDEQSAGGMPTRVGDCTITGVLGKGGMGIVYRGIQDIPRRTVAIKVIRAPALTRDAAGRFRQETELLSRVDHPGVAKVYATGVFSHAGGAFPYVVMELIADAMPIGSKRADGAHDQDALLRCMADACDAIQAAHSSLIIHRDLKPANILVDGSGRVRIIDFGVATALEPWEGLPTVETLEERVVGTAHYMAPEIIERSGRAASTRSDVFSLGVILYELMTGMKPFEGEATTMFAVMRRVTAASGVPDRPEFRRLPPDLRTIIRMAMARDPAMRYDSAGTLGRDLRRYLARQPIEARTPSRAYVARKFVERHKLAVALSVIVAVALCATTILSLVSRSRERDARHLADRNAHQASVELYRAVMSSACRAIELGNASEAAALLEKAPVGLRDWDHRFLSSLLNNAAESVLVGQQIDQLAFADDGSVRVWGARGSGRLDQREFRWDPIDGRVMPGQKPPAMVAMDTDADIRVIASYPGASGGTVTLRLEKAASASLEIDLPLGRLQQAALSGDTSLLAVAGSRPDHTPVTCLVDTESGRILWEHGLNGPMAMVGSPPMLVIVDDALHVISARGDGYVLDSIPISLTGKPTQLTGDETGHRVAIRTVRAIEVIELSSQEVICSIPTSSDGSLAFDESGEWLALAENETIHIIRVADGTAAMRLFAPGAEIGCILVSRERDQVIAVDKDGILHRWSGILGWCEAARARQGQIGHAPGSAGVWFDVRDPGRILWTSDTISRVLQSQPVEHRVLAAALSHDGTTIAYSKEPGVVTQVDSIQQSIRLPEPVFIRSLNFSGTAEPCLIWRGALPNRGLESGWIQAGSLSSEPLPTISPDVAEVRSRPDGSLLLQRMNDAEILRLPNVLDSVVENIPGLWDVAERNGHAVSLNVQGLVEREAGSQKSSTRLPWVGSETIDIQLVSERCMVALHNTGRLCFWRPDLGTDFQFSVVLVHERVVDAGEITEFGVVMSVTPPGVYWYPLDESPTRPPTRPRIAGQPPES